MKKNISLHVDCAVDTTPEAIHARIARQLHLPTWYGANVDALHDALSEKLIEYTIHLTWIDTAVSKKQHDIQAIHALLMTAISPTLHHHSSQ